MHTSIYIVDDCQDSAQAFAILLRMEGFNTSPFTSYDTALASLQPNAPCVVLADAHVHGMQLEEFAERLRQQNADTQIIVISGDIRMKDTAAELGAQFLLKPADVPQVIELLREACAKLNVPAQG
jgi:FixJ family two-component response regulator